MKMSPFFVKMGVLKWLSGEEIKWDNLELIQQSNLW